MRGKRVLATVATALLCAGCAPAEQNSQPATAESITAEPISIQQSEKKVDKTENNVEVNVAYPQFGVEAVDTEIEQFVQTLTTQETERLAEVVTTMRESMMEIAETDTDREMAEHLVLGFGIDYEVTQASADGIDVVFMVREYEGGAHDSLALYTYMFDPKTGDIIPTLSVIDPDESTALSRLSSVCREKLPAKLGEDINPDMFQDGTEPTAENFRNIVRTPNGVRVYFAPYAIAPWAVGIVSIDL